MKILITGAAGTIGRTLHQYLTKQGHQVQGIDIETGKNWSKLDLRDPIAIEQCLQELRPAAILHLAAMKNILQCEREKDAAHQINFKASAYLAEYCQRHETRLVYFSTDYVFGNSENSWGEDASPNPTTQYGRDKAASEEFIQNHLKNFAVIRPAQVYGFTGDFSTLVRGILISQSKFFAYRNLVNCPTFLPDLMEMTSQILTRNLVGYFHCVGPESLSRYEYALEIAKSFDLDLEKIIPIDLDFDVDIRPPSIRLNGQVTYDRLGFYPRTIRQALGRK